MVAGAFCFDISLNQLFRSAGDFQQVVSELSFDRAVDDIQFVIEDNLVEFWNHLALTEFSEVATFLTGRAL